MTISRPVLSIAVATSLLGGIWLANHGQIRAQDGDPAIRKAESGKTRHIADAMLLPARLPFAEKTSLEAVAAYLRKELKANVILDRAALGRLKLEPTDTVQLDLSDVRLKTGLKLLLDQVGLTTKIVAEDNLLIITDKEESDEPIDRVLEEIKALHRDVHSLQDDVRDLRNLIEAPIAEDEPGALMRKPTIIEEKPGPKDDSRPEPSKKTKEKPSRTRAGI
jgi:hypothetical protein